MTDNYGNAPEVSTEPESDAETWISYTDENGDTVRVTVAQYVAEGR